MGSCFGQKKRTAKREVNKEEGESKAKNRKQMQFRGAIVQGK